VGPTKARRRRRRAGGRTGGREGGREGKSGPTTDAARLLAV